jgi:hypothetical protein
VWTAAQTAQFLASIEGHRLYAVFHLIALRGLRRGEAAGLRWCDIDLDARTAVITQQLQQHDGRLVICPPKTAHSARVIALEPLGVVGVVGGGAGSVAGDEPLETDGESADSTPLARSQTARRAISRRQVLSRRLTRSIDGWRYVDFATLGDSERDVRT